MNNNSQNDIDNLITQFTDESEEQLEQANNLVFEHLNNPKDVELINEIFRILHTIKGNSSIMGF